MGCCRPYSKTAPIRDAVNLDEVKHALENCRTIFIVFYTKTCGVCKAFLPVYESIAGLYRDSITFLKVDADRLRELALALGIMSVSSTIAIIDGKLVGSFQGFIEEDRLKSLVEKTLELAGCT